MAEYTFMTHTHLKNLHTASFKYVCCHGARRSRLLCYMVIVNMCVSLLECVYPCKKEKKVFRCLRVVIQEQVISQLIKLVKACFFHNFSHIFCEDLQEITLSDRNSDLGWADSLVRMCFFNIFLVSFDRKEMSKRTTECCFVNK